VNLIPVQENPRTSSEKCVRHTCHGPGQSWALELAVVTKSTHAWCSWPGPRV